MPPPPYRLSQHALDIVFKLEAEQLGTALGRRFPYELIRGGRQSVFPPSAPGCVAAPG